MARNWAERIRDDLLWTRLYLRRHEAKAERTIRRVFRDMKDSMKALLEIDQRTNYISDKTIASRVFVHRHIRPRMKEIAFIVLGTMGKRMMLAANDMRDAMRAAFYMRPHPYIRVKESEIISVVTIPEGYIQFSKRVEE